MLSDPDRRQLYDAYGHEGLKTGGYQPNFGDFGSISDLFSAFFGAGGFDAAFGGGAHARRRRCRAATSRSRWRSSSPTPRTASRSRSPTTRARAAPPATATAPSPGTPIETCARCQGAGQLQAVSRTRVRPARAQRRLRRLRRRRPVAARPVRDVPRRRHGRRAAARRGRRPGRHRRRAADPRHRPRPRRRARRPERRPLRRRPGARGRAVPARRQRPRHRRRRRRRRSPRSARPSRCPTLDGPIPVEIKAGTQPGEEIRLGGRGMPPLQRGRTGDLRVVSTSRSRAGSRASSATCSRRFADTLTDDNQRDDEGMIAKLRRVLAG